MLPCALGEGDLAILKPIHPLAGIDAVAVCGSQGMGNIPFVTANAVAAVLRLTVDGIAHNADDLLPLHEKEAHYFRRSHTGRTW